jgi:hypothetical protein
LKIGIWNNDETDGNSKETTYGFENCNSPTVINSALTIEYKNGKFKRTKDYRPANWNQHTIGPYSLTTLQDYNDSGSGTSSQCRHGDYPGVDYILDISANTLYL